MSISRYTYYVLSRYTHYALIRYNRYTRNSLQGCKVLVSAVDPDWQSHWPTEVSFDLFPLNEDSTCLNRAYNYEILNDSILPNGGKVCHVPCTLYPHPNLTFYK